MENKQELEDGECLCGLPYHDPAVISVEGKWWCASCLEKYIAKKLNRDGVERKKIGVVGVDSGQIMVCDPCYIDSQWAKEDFQDIRIVQDVKTKDTFQFRKDFENYDSIIDTYGKSVNDLIENGTLIQLKDDSKATNNFSYNACCKATLGEEVGGQLNYTFGHPGVGVAVRSGFGDGVYDVFAEIKDCGEFGKRVSKVEIILIED